MIRFDPEAELYDYPGFDGEELRNCVSRLRVEALSGPAETFALNIGAIDSFLKLPWYLVGFGHGWGTRDVLVFVQNYLHAKSLPSEDVEEIVTAYRSKVKSMKERVETPRTESDSLDDCADLLDETTPQIVPPDVRMALGRSDNAPAVRSLLAFTSVATWTAVESLAKDLWISCVNLRLDPLAKNALRVQGGGTGEGDSKSIKAVWLAKYGFDLRDRMGTLLVEDENKFQFDSPKLIRKSYVAAFGQSPETEGLWQEIGYDLGLLNLTRNLVAHRAGIVDQKFVDQTRLAIPVGEYVPLNAENVANFLTVATQAACELLAFVDVWFASNPINREPTDNEL